MCRLVAVTLVYTQYFPYLYQKTKIMICKETKDKYDRQQPQTLETGYRTGQLFFKSNSNINTRCTHEF